MKEFTFAQLNDVALSLKSGKAIIIPTDTVWGIIATQENIIYEVKHRPLTKKIVVFVNNLDNLDLPKAYKEVLSQYLPGALTFIYRKIGYRIPDSKFILDILAKVGNCYCSSANISGDPPINNVLEAQRVFGNNGDKVAIVRPPDDWKLSHTPSTVIDLDNFTVLRQGTIDGNEILNKLKKGKE